MVSIGIYIISKGFFNGITYSFRRFISRLPKNRDLLNEWEDKPLPSARVSTSFAGKLLFQGAILTGIMLVLLVIYYL